MLVNLVQLFFALFTVTTVILDLPTLLATFGVASLPFPFLLRQLPFEALLRESSLVPFLLDPLGFGRLLLQLSQLPPFSLPLISGLPEPLLQPCDDGPIAFSLRALGFFYVTQFPQQSRIVQDRIVSLHGVVALVLRSILIRRLLGRLFMHLLEYYRPQ